MNKEVVTSVTIPTSVISIEAFAFAQCRALIRVDIPSSVARIERHAFQGCTSLASVAIPSSVTSIDEYAFCGCSSLTSVAIPSSVTFIGWNAFYECSSLIRVAIPSSVTSIAQCAFYKCSALASVDIPASVTIIESHAFEDCSSLTNVDIPASVTSIDQYTFDGCSSLASVAIPSSVVFIDNTAFRGCSALTALMIKPAVRRRRRRLHAGRSADVAGAAHVRAGIIGAFNDTPAFQTVTKIWATDDVVADLNGVFAPYACFADIPGTMRVAPDATTWAAVELWLWWLPPTELELRNEDDGYDRVVCNSRQTTIWTTMLSAYNASEVLETLPDLEPELWLHIFGFVKHDAQATFPATGWGRYKTGFDTAASASAGAGAGAGAGVTVVPATAANSASSGSCLDKSRRRRPRRRVGGGGGGSVGSSAFHTAVVVAGLDAGAGTDTGGFNLAFPVFGDGSANGNGAFAFGAASSGSNADAAADGFNAGAGAGAGAGGFGDFSFGIVDPVDSVDPVDASAVPWGTSFAPPAGTDPDASDAFGTMPASSSASFAPLRPSLPKQVAEEDDTQHDVATIQTGVGNATLTDDATEPAADPENE